MVSKGTASSICRYLCPRKTSDNWARFFTIGLLQGSPCLLRNPWKFHWEFLVPVISSGGITCPRNTLGTLGNLRLESKKLKFGSKIKVEKLTWIANWGLWSRSKPLWGFLPSRIWKSWLYGVGSVSLHCRRPTEGKPGFFVRSGVLASISNKERRSLSTCCSVASAHLASCFKAEAKACAVHQVSTYYCKLPFFLWDQSVDDLDDEEEAYANMLCSAGCLNQKYMQATKLCRFQTNQDSS